MWLYLLVRGGDDEVEQRRVGVDDGLVDEAIYLNARKQHVLNSQQPSNSLYARRGYTLKRSHTNKDMIHKSWGILGYAFTPRARDLDVIYLYHILDVIYMS